MDNVDIWKRIEEKKGAAFAAQLREVVKDPELGSFIVINDPAAPRDGIAAEAVTGAVESIGLFQGQKPSSVAPNGLRPVLGGVSEAMNHRSYFNAPDLPSRPKEDGLIEAITALATTKQRQPGKMSLTQTSADELVMLATLIGLNRQLFKVASRFLRNVVANLAVLEDSAFRLAKDDYDVIRAAAQRDEVLNDLLEDTEEYFYGSAKQGAQTAKDNKVRVKELQAAAEQKGRLAGEKDTRNLIAEEAASLVQLMQTMGGARTLPR